LKRDTVRYLDALLDVLEVIIDIKTPLAQIHHLTHNTLAHMMCAKETEREREREGTCLLVEGGMTRWCDISRRSALCVLVSLVILQQPNVSHKQQAMRTKER
jgi:hypothetical protein